MEFMCLQREIRDPFESVQYRFFAITDFREGESILVFKCHHCLSDGVGIFEMLCLLNDEPSLEDLPPYRKHSLCKKILMYLLVPLAASTEGLKIMLSRHDKNPLKPSGTISGKKRAVCRFNFGCTLPQMKAHCRKTGVTINDLLVSTLSTTCYEYF